MTKEKKFDGKVVLITGSTRGIGLAIAKAFSNEGALIGLNGRDQQVVEETRKNIQELIACSCWKFDCFLILIQLCTHCNICLNKYPVVIIHYSIIF